MAEYTRFPNLAGSDTSDEVCARELEAAGIEVVTLPESCRYGEPKTVVMGQLGMWGFKRAWRYWIAEGPGIPPVEAEALHEEHGKVVRVDGHCGAPSPLEWFKGFAVGHYHVDAQEGLTALAETLNTLRRDR
jgi:hypothetical protein